MLRSAEQRELAEALTDLCVRHVTPEYVRRCDDGELYPVEAMSELAAAGWAGLAVAEEYGGSGGSASDLAVAHRTLARHAFSVAQAYYSLWVLGAAAIGGLGTERQKAEWLPQLAEGKVRIAFALTEPESGSDASALRTTATRSENGVRRQRPEGLHHRRRGRRPDHRGRAHGLERRRSA